ncbi:Collagen alpha-1(XX) chain [Liparis tanakae]|uniref:Collagen alpha-1(XX) chain n=1 Tax=Liparis tanakae TaxID=230148 RepID=A0A4Z2DZ27_9TELE|nr:Collagen alpha-1(XX) chain [Liparis tanakae]
MKDAACWGAPGRLKLTVLSEDRLQMKWKEADGPVQGYKVRVRPISGESIPGPAHPRALTSCPPNTVWTNFQKAWLISSGRAEGHRRSMRCIILQM